MPALPLFIPQPLFLTIPIKKLLFVVAAIGCFVSSSLPSFAQWTTVTGGINYSGGRVGIGFATPRGLLHFPTSHTNRKIVLFESVANDHQFYGLGTSPDVMRFHIPGSTRSFRFYRADDAASSTEIFTILGTGSVGIGTTNPGTYKLAVAGKIASWGEIKVLNPGTAFPDYVFAPAYKLRSLAEVEAFIQQNQHLPEVPSAATVEQEGMGLVEMNTIAIKKIEELTLYLIEQNKRLTKLEQENAQLQREVETLRK